LTGRTKSTFESDRPVIPEVSASTIKPSCRMRKACDACSIRKVQCDGRKPCRRCVASHFDCTYLKSRAKPGPKGPRKKTTAAIRILQEQAAAAGAAEAPRTPVTDHAGCPIDSISQTWSPPPQLDDTTPHVTFDPYIGTDKPLFDPMPMSTGDWIPPLFHTYTSRSPPPQSQSFAASPLPPPPSPYFPSSIDITIPTSTIAQTLTTYTTRATSIWPVIDAPALITHLYTNPSDLPSYALATSICAACVSQFEPAPRHNSGSSASSHSHGGRPMDASPSSPSAYHRPCGVSAADHATECERARTVFGWRDKVSLPNLLTSFFLHVHAANAGRWRASTLFLGEAVGMAHLLGLHKRSYYDELQQQAAGPAAGPAAVADFSLTVYWLLFVTDRAHAFQHDLPTALRAASEIEPLPPLTPSRNVSQHFLSLCTLFSLLDKAINSSSSCGASSSVGAGAGASSSVGGNGGNDAATRAAIAKAHALLNQQLQADGEVGRDGVEGADAENGPSPTPSETEIQRADVFMTRQWMRIFLWQYSLRLTNLNTSSPVASSTAPRRSSITSIDSFEASYAGEEGFSLQFPETVAREALRFVRYGGGGRLQSLEVHGPGMETKLFEITNALADVMLCIPSFSVRSLEGSRPRTRDGGHGSAMAAPARNAYGASRRRSVTGGMSPAAVVHELAVLLAGFRGGASPAVIGLLQEKLWSASAVGPGWKLGEGGLVFPSDAKEIDGMVDERRMDWGREEEGEDEEDGYRAEPVRVEELGTVVWV
jgi:hypothetical protein